MINKTLCAILVLFSFNTQAKWFVSSSVDPMTDVKTTIGVSSTKSIVIFEECHDFLFSFRGFREQVGSNAFMLVRVDKNPPILLLTSSWLSPSMVTVRSEALISNGLYDQMLGGGKIYFQVKNSKNQKMTVADDLIGFTKTTKILGCDKDKILARVQLEKKLAEIKRETEKLKHKTRVAKKKTEDEKNFSLLEKEKLRQTELDRKMEAEFTAAFKNASRTSEVAKYKELIKSKIRRNWEIDKNMKGKSCTIHIRLASDGFVLGAKRESGDEKLCASVTRATFKANHLPIPIDIEMSQEFRYFYLTLKADS